MADIDEIIGQTDAPPDVAEKSPFTPTAAPARGNGHPARPTREQVNAARTLPHSVVAEEGLLGCCLMDEGASLGKCIEAGIKAVAFYHRPASIIFAALLAMQAAGKPIDTSGLLIELQATKRDEEIGGIPYLMQVSQSVPTTLQAATFIETIRKLYARRELIRVSLLNAEQAYEDEDVLESAEARVRQVADAAKGKTPFADWTTNPTLETYPKRGANILLGSEGALKRGGSLEWVGPTGTGKSSSIIGACLSWCRGVAFLGMVCHGPLKILVIEAEDDEEILSKLVVSYMEFHKLSQPEKDKIRKNFVVTQVKGVIGPEFFAVVEQKCKLHRPDIMVINPVSRYIHGSMSDDKTVIEFTSWLDAVNVKLGNTMGIICVSHTGKPPKGEEAKRDKSAYEMAYMSVGSSQWANYYRATVYLEPRMEAGRYRFQLAKLGYAWGIRREFKFGDETKYEAILTIPAQHCTDTIEIEGEKRPMIVWLPDVEEVPPAKDGGKKADKKGGFTGAEVIACYPASNAEACGYGESLRNASETLGLPKGVFDRWRESLLEDGMLMRCGKGYKRTAAGDDLALQAPGGDKVAEGPI